MRLPGKYAYAVALLLVALPACAAPEMIPTATGNRWEFRVNKLLRAQITFAGKTMASLNDPSSGTAVYEVLSTDEGTDPPVYSYSETTDLMSVNGTSDTDKMNLSVTHVDGVLKILSTLQVGQGDEEDETQNYNPPLFYYTTEAAAGKSWSVGDLRDGDTVSATSARGAGRETVTVPAGTFKDCLKIIYSSDTTTGTLELWDKTFKITAGRFRGIYWIAEGVGVVKELEVSTSTAETPGPDGSGSVALEAATCVVSELMPGYVVK